MRIRSILAGFAIGAGVLVLSAPGALADTNGQTQTPTSTRVREAAPASTTTRPAVPTVSPAPAEPRPAQVDKRGQVVKPVGAAETGAGMEDASSNTGLFVIGGVGLVALAGGGTVALRRTRKQS